jgi:hypothetical protein
MSEPIAPESCDGCGKVFADDDYSLHFKGMLFCETCTDELIDELESEEIIEPTDAPEPEKDAAND